jgi:DNA-binding transcriptional ArsR family regulator
MDDESDAVFKALADGTRRHLLDRLFVEDGLTVTDLERELPMSRFGVAKHLRVLEAANLVTVRAVGRERRHYLNRIPIRQIHDRWIDKYTEPGAVALIALKNQLEESQ